MLLDSGTGLVKVGLGSLPCFLHGLISGLLHFIGTMLSMPEGSANKDPSSTPFFFGNLQCA